MRNFLFFAVALFLIYPDTALAHKVNLFCYIENNTVQGEGYFSQGAPVKHATVEIYDAATETLVGKTNTDAQGTFSLPVHGTKDIKVVLIAGMGHRAEYLLSRSETPEASPTEEVHAGSVVTAFDYNKIAAIVHQEIQPLRDDFRRLEKRQSSPGIVSIGGGLGWIVGIFSLLYLVRNKNAS